MIIVGIGCIFATTRMMKHFYLLSLSFGVFALFSACQVQAPVSNLVKSSKLKTVLYFNPTVYPEIEEVKEPTYAAFFEAVNERVSRNRNYKMMRVETAMDFDSVQIPDLVEYCEMNTAAFAVIPKVKFFKVGFGKYVLSNQVIVSLKLYDSTGKLVAESDYDTYRKKARMLGSAENSIKIGTEGALKLIGQHLRKGKNTAISFSDN